ncbi:MAG: purine-nucleoside phosphorylase [Coriobacteriales bacterium]|jgi:purine-nucleoside phosphorylase|nr:purine-nucleoside phosphorylase [Coriobacteriales bacterium]
MPLADRIDQAIAHIRPSLSEQPDIALILGSGLGGLAERLNIETSFEYADIPHFKASGAPGHTGRLLFGTLAGRKLVCMQGRLHNYEGHTPDEIVFPLQVMYALGARTLIVTNAAGGVNLGYAVGDIMLISDHINFFGANPLTIGSEQGLGNFVDMSYTYTPALRTEAHRAAEALGLTLREGVYLGLRGPNFETPAEIRAFRTWGADAVGMSTVFEVLAAAQRGMRVLGLSLITNMAAGILDEPLSGEDVIRTSKIAARDMESLIIGLLPNL